MANAQQLEILMQGVDVWNAWRKEQPNIQVDLNQANFHRAELPGINLRRANLKEANLSEANLYKADLLRANLTKANLREAILHEARLYEAVLQFTQLQQAKLSNANLMNARFTDANLTDADLHFALLDHAHFSSVNLQRANLEGAELNDIILRNVSLADVNLHKADFTRATFENVNLSNARLSQTSFSGAKLRPVRMAGVNLRGVQFDWATLDAVDLSGIDLSGANLRHATLDRVKLDQANLTDCLVSRIVVWDTSLDGAIQQNLHLNDEYEPVVTLDSLANAQLLSLLLSRDTPPPLIRTMSTNMVVILGYFPPYRMAVLDTMRDELRRQGYMPVLFDRDSATSPLPGDESVVEREYPEMLERLVTLARFLLLDLTEMRVLPREIQTVLPTSHVPLQPILLSKNRQGTTLVPMIKSYPQQRPLFMYNDEADLQRAMQEDMLAAAERMIRSQEDGGKQYYVLP